MLSSRQADQVSTGMFLIGLGVLAATHFWWPGIMFVLGAAAIARGLTEGRGWYALQGGLWMIGLGLVFLQGFSLPLLLVLIGVSYLLGNVIRPPFIRDRQKAKNDAPLSDHLEDDAGEYELGDDGELVKVKNDQQLTEHQSSEHP
jgi:hypothetical protein